MTPEQLKERINFRAAYDTTHCLTTLSAILYLKEEMLITEEVPEIYMETLKEQMRETMARHIYEDRRIEFREMLTEFMHHSIPADYEYKGCWQQVVKQLLEWSAKL